MCAFEHYKNQNFEKVRGLNEDQKWRVTSNIRFKDLREKVNDPDATVHICLFCKSTGFQLHEIKPPRSKAVEMKLVASCLGCGQWYNLDKYTFH